MPLRILCLVRRTHALTEDELVALLEEAVARGVLSEDGMDEIARADVVVRGQRRDGSGEVYSESRSPGALDLETSNERSGAPPS